MLRKENKKMIIPTIEDLELTLTAREIILYLEEQMKKYSNSGAYDYYSFIKNQMFFDEINNIYDWKEKERKK